MRLPVFTVLLLAGLPGMAGTVTSSPSPGTPVTEWVTVQSSSISQDVRDVLDTAKLASQTASPELRSFRVTNDFLSAVRSQRVMIEKPPQNPDGAAVLMLTLGALTLLIRRARLDKTIDVNA